MGPQLEWEPKGLGLQRWCPLWFSDLSDVCQTQSSHGNLTLAHNNKAVLQTKAASAFPLGWNYLNRNVILCDVGYLPGTQAQCGYECSLFDKQTLSERGAPWSLGSEDKKPLCGELSKMLFMK